MLSLRSILCHLLLNLLEYLYTNTYSYIIFYIILILFYSFRKKRPFLCPVSGFFSLYSFCKLHFTIYTFYLHISKKSSNFASKLRDMTWFILFMAFTCIAFGFVLGFIKGRNSH